MGGIYQGNFLTEGERFIAWFEKKNRNLDKKEIPTASKENLPEEIFLGDFMREEFFKNLCEGSVFLGEVSCGGRGPGVIFHERGGGCNGMIWK